MTRKPPAADSVLNEPHFQAPPLPPRTSDAPLDSVWMEPTHGTHLENGAHPYAAWLDLENSRQSSARAWVRTFGLALCAGPLAVLSVFLTRNPASGMLVVVVAGPLIEEVGIAVFLDPLF